MLKHTQRKVTKIMQYAIRNVLKTIAKKVFVSQVEGYQNG